MPTMVITPTGDGAVKNLYYPNEIGIFITTECNLKCNYCFVFRNKRIPHKKVNLATKFKKGINIFLDLPGRAKTICFTGGEPLIVFNELKSLIEYLEDDNNKHRLKVILNTNGLLLSRNRLSFLKSHNIHVKLSFDGTKECHDYNRKFFRKNISSFERVICKLKEVDNKRYDLFSSLVFTPDTCKKLSENIFFLLRKGFSHIEFNPNCYSDWSNIDLSYLKKEFDKIVDFYLQFLKNNKRPLFHNSFLYGLINNDNIYKPAICRKIFLGAEGDFYYCHKAFAFPVSRRRQFIIGDVNTGINNKLRLELLDKKRKEISTLTGINCEECLYLKYCFCRIGCFISLPDNKNVKRYFKNFCDISKIYIESFLKISQLYPAIKQIFI